MKKYLLPLLGLCCMCFADEGYDTGSYREITPNAGPRVSGGADVFITADFIYWKAYEEGLGYATTGYGSTGITPTSRGSVKQPDFKFEPGFKVGLGLNLSHDGWDLYAEYTWRHAGNTKSRTREDAGDSTLRYNWTPLDGNAVPLSGSDRLTFASGNWRLQFNVLDAEIGRNFYISRYLTLRPFTGFKGTWQDQNYIVKYETIPSPTLFDLIRIGQHENFWGVGIRSGLDTAWHATKHWSIVGNVALTALWSDYSVKRRDRTRSSDVVDSSVTFNTKNGFSTIKPILELQLGLRWETWFYDDDYHISFLVGWEEQIWFSRNQFIHLFEESAHGDLTMHGLTIHGRFDF